MANDLIKYKDLINNRKRYLDDLYNIDAILDVAYLPSKKAISKSKEFLGIIEKFICEKNEMPMQILIGLIPSKGISIEVYKNENNAIYVSFLNDGAAYMDVKESDYFYDIGDLNIDIFFSKYLSFN